MRCRIVLFLALLTTFSVQSQEEDLELWSSIKFSKKVNSKLRFIIEEQIRWSDSIRVYKKNFTDVGLKLKLHKRHSLSAHFRLNSDANREKKTRSHIDFCSDFDIDKLDLIFKQRLRLQQSWDEVGEVEKQYFRSKLGVEFKTKFIRPFLSHEFYWRIDQQYLMNQQRSTIGLSWDMFDDVKSKVFFRTENEMNQTKPDKLSIIGLGVHYKF